MASRHHPFKAFGIETQIPRWTLTPLALILICGIGYYIYRTVYEQPEQILLSLKDANRQLAAEVEEYSLHAMEEPQKHELFEEADGKLMLRVFKDHCVLIQRQTRGGTRSKLVVDLARGGTVAVATRQVEQPPQTLLASLFPVLLAAQACNRGCLHPHPGEFRWWYGARQGEWVEVWRQWPEGCKHAQLFNPNRGIWDTNPDGTARVRWACCVH